MEAKKKNNARQECCAQETQQEASASKSKLCFLNYYIGFPHGLGGLVVELLLFYIFGFSTFSS